MLYILCYGNQENKSLLDAALALVLFFALLNAYFFKISIKKSLV